MERYERTLSKNVDIIGDLFLIGFLFSMLLLCCCCYLHFEMVFFFF